VNEINSLENADIALGKAVASNKENPAVRVASQLGKLGDQEPLYIAAAALVVAGLAGTNCRLARAGFTMLAAVAAADAGKTFLKHRVHRTRPNVTLDEGRYASGVGHSEQKPQQSFPSGHMAGTVAAVRAVARHYPRIGPWGAAASVAIALTRMAKGAHWPLDIAAGAVIGIGAEALSGSFLKALAAPFAGWCGLQRPAGWRRKGR
jgi:membrane-associated phospholipid phosphatase